MRAYKILSSSAVILLIAVLFSGVATVPAAAQNDMMMFHYNAQHTGDYSPVAGNTQPNNHLKWKFTTGDWVRSSPAVVNGVVYVGSWDEKIYALNANSGAQKWNFTTGDRVTSSPAVANGIVYVGSGDGNLYALYANNGTKLWNFTTGSWPYIDSDPSPTIANGVVYVGSGDANFYALNATTGEKIWNYPMSDPVPTTIASAAVANGNVYVGVSGWGGTVYALNATTGDYQWSDTTDGGIEDAAAYANGVVYVGDVAGSVYAFNASTGAQKWVFPTAFETGFAIWSSPCVVNGQVYIGRSGETNVLYALNASLGTETWNYTFADTVFSSPAYANGVVYVGSWDQNSGLCAFNATTGAKMWNYPIAGTFAGGVSSSAAVVNGVVYVGGQDDNVYAIGTQAGITSTLTAATSPTTVAVNRSFSVSGALNTPDGVLKTKAGAPIAGATIQLQKNVSGTWQDVAGKTATTGAAGAYRISMSEPTAGTYQYRVTYAGNATYANATSGVVTVTVTTSPPGPVPSPQRL